MRIVDVRVALVRAVQEAFPRLALAGALIATGLTASIAVSGTAQADIRITVDKASQKMAVHVHGRLEHVWTVSTGTRGGPPSGSFRPTRMYRSYFSRTYDNAPMPHSIFFHHGFAIHGTNQIGRLGRPASKGCVRLHPGNARTLFNMVRRAGMDRTRVVITNGPRISQR